MRLLIVILVSISVLGCSAKSSRENEAEVIQKLGLITAKQDSSRDEIERDSGVRTSVYGSFSTGGNVSIGIGFLLNPFFSSDSDATPLRYEVDLLDGDQITIYHRSGDFEIGDCVLISVFPDEDKNPPTMKRRKGECG